MLDIMEASRLLMNLRNILNKAQTPPKSHIPNKLYTFEPEKKNIVCYFFLVQIMYIALLVAGLCFRGEALEYAHLSFLDNLWRKKSMFLVSWMENR